MIIHGVEEVSTLDKIGSIRYLFRSFVVNAKGNNFPCWGNKKTSCPQWKAEQEAINKFKNCENLDYSNMFIPQASTTLSQSS